MNNNVDIVITWVDGSDPNWLAEKKMYTKKSNNVRYRDWDNLVYIFRGIEQFMPWVHKIYFVTWGHLPKWLNIDNEKLVIVNHQDYIPEKYLPTFNSNVLDLNMFRIPGLSEQYINFNDDTFVIKPTKLEDFFYNGKPKDMACISPQPINRDMIMNIELNNMEIINDYFSINDIKRNKKKWLNFKMYGSYAIRTLIFMRFKTILGFFVPHIPISHLKSVSYYVVFEQDKPILIAGFRKYNKDTVILLGSRAGYDYCDIIWSNENVFEDGIKLVFAELKRSKIKNIIWKFWEVDSYSFTTIKKLVNVVEINEVKNTRINIGNYDSYDDYWKSLGKHAKQNVRTAYNRLKRENKKIEFKFYDSNTICENNFCTKLDEFLDLYLVRQSLKYKGGKKLHQLYLSKFNYITNSLRNDHSIMMEIRIDDELAAFMQGTLNSDWSEYEIPRLAINDKFAFFSPGMILVNEAIKYMMGNTDIKIFNLCRGDEKYKYDMGGENYYTANVKLTLN